MTAAAYLILHGIENHRPPEHWQFWLTARLRDRGHHVLYPGLPDPDKPCFDSWVRVLREQLAQMEGRERVVVCHSLACLMWFGAAPAFDDVCRVDRLLLVSPPASERVPEGGASFRLSHLDVDAVIASVGSTIRIVCSDADPYNPIGADVLYAGDLDAEVDLIPGAGHITPSTGYGPWPSAKAWCLDPSQRLRADGERARTGGAAS
jgi:uncharacterized protein